MSISVARPVIRRLAGLKAGVGALAFVLALATALSACGSGSASSSAASAAVSTGSSSSSSGGSSSGSQPINGNLQDLPLDLAVKQIDQAALEAPIYGSSDSRTAASEAFQNVLQPYFNTSGAAAQAAILARIVFSCGENLTDPTGTSQQLHFPVALDPAQPGAVLWHRYSCTFTITNGSTVYTSPQYAINQLDVSYGAEIVEPGTALQNYAVPAGSGQYPWLGRYVQPLNMMLRDNNGNPPAKVLGGVNAGYDYRVDAWANDEPHDNICPGRDSPLPTDRLHFYSHPAAAQCTMTASDLPACASGTTLPIADDLGDSLLFLAPAQRARSWRTTPFQSPNCGGVAEVFDRGAMMFFADGMYANRTSPSLDGLDELVDAGQSAVSAVSAGPSLILDQHFVYDQDESEEGMPNDNYELGGQIGVGYAYGSGGGQTLHIVEVDGVDNEVGMHDWVLGLYFLSPYAQSDGAVALGHGGDATLWINPQAPAVQSVLGNPSDPDFALFQTLFTKSNVPGVVSNCSGYTKPPISCSARPVHDGLFVYTN
jgi:hypothetical protein